MTDHLRSRAKRNTLSNSVIPRTAADGTPLQILILLLLLCISVAANAGSTYGSDASRPWKDIDSVNRVMAKYPSSMPEPLLEGCFARTVEILKDASLGALFDRARDEAFSRGDFREIDACTVRCKPAIDVFVMGESNNIGVNVDAFLERCCPGSRFKAFFLLARDGFVIRDHVAGTAVFPRWIERTESSFQGRILPGQVKIYLKKWKELLPETSGVFAEIARQTVDSLERVQDAGQRRNMDQQ